MDTPFHVAIILDGNGRWAKSKGMPRNYGHTVGAKNVETICRAANDIGIKYLTVYAFSTENWNRPKDEVDALMKLLQNFLDTCLRTASRNNMRVRVLGDLSGFDQIRKRVEELELSSQNNTGLQFQIALNYGGRDEIVRAVRKIACCVREEGLDPKSITEQTVESFLDTKGIPDPDLMIRTSGEQRLSNFLLWQLAYTEFYFTNVPWPAFTKKDLENAVMEYRSRDRRYGKIKEE